MYFFVSKTILQQKEPELFTEMVDFRSGAGNIQDEAGTFCSAESKKVLKTKQNVNSQRWDYVKEKRESIERASVANAGTVWATK